MPDYPYSNGTAGGVTYAMDTIAERLPPHSIEAEEAVLGSLLIDPDAVFDVQTFLRAGDFYRSANRWVYEAMCALHDRKVPLDVVTLIEELRRRERLEEIGGESAVIGLLNAVPTSINVEAYGRAVHDAALRRRLLAAAGGVAKLAWDEARPVEQVIGEAERAIFAVSGELTADSVIDARAAFDALYDVTSQRRDAGGVPVGVPSGLVDLDRILRGFKRGDLYIIAGRPAMGKSSFATSLVAHMARKLAQRVALFTLEMSVEQQSRRLASMEAGIAYQDLEEGRMDDDGWTRFATAAGRWAEVKLWIDDTAAITPGQMAAKARRIHAEHGLDILFVDYLQLMGVDEKAWSDNHRVALISAGLKKLAKDLNIPVVALCQLNRAVESRGDKRPTLADLRDSGCLTGDTLICMADTGRRVALRELVGRSGFSVWALDERNYRMVRAEVSRAFSTGIKPVYRLTTALGRTIRATANHPFLTVDGWQRLDQLECGNHIAVPRRVASGQTRTMSDAELALLGHLIGDGCTLPKHVIQYTTREPELAQTVMELAQEVFPDGVRPRCASERSWYQVYLPSTHSGPVRSELRRWLESMGVFGLRSYEKHVPECVFEQDEIGIALFLRHLWVTDGCIGVVQGKSPRPNIYYATSSARLATDVQALLLRVGINARLMSAAANSKGRAQYQGIVSGRADVLHFAGVVGTVGSARAARLAAVVDILEDRQENTNRDVIPADVWRLHVRPAMQDAGVTTRALYAGINTAYSGMTIFRQNVSRERAARVAAVVRSEPLAALAASDVYWDRIVSIELVGEEEVFDLTVPGPHNFVANEIVVHNSLEQDASAVIFLYRDEYYNKNSDKPNITEVIVAKHRNGPTGSADAYFNAKAMRFSNLYHKEIDL